MKIDIIFPVLPPRIDGIGDYTACMAVALSKKHDVRILTSGSHDDISGVEILSCFDINTSSGIRGIVKPLVSRSPDLILLQYNPFSFGKWGYAPKLGSILRAVHRQLPKARLGVVIHERWVDITSWKTAIMTTWQRKTLRSILAASSIVCVSTESWIPSIRKRSRSANVVHLPVGSNIPRINADRNIARASLGLSDDTLAIGLFGTAHPSRQLHFVKAALEKLNAHNRSFEVFYIGPSGDKVSTALAPMPVRRMGTLPAAEVSTCISSMDIYLAPFSGGVAERRGSFLVGIQHGIPTISTKGEQTPKMMLRATDAFWLTADDDSGAFAESVFTLANSPELRSQMKSKAESFFEVHFSWDGLAQRLMNYVEEMDS